ncbi:MAG: hypothetical protein A2W93_02200 [Bacteroidetes bacterium GWF2_43_63]|nr:MAG: hypothetical protein A2W93_02200 [Bacteroidetes bacterium GWF2_43_63]HBG69276.1 hypothetical protein [Bacteroidales bacterium]HCB60330.1 hypothetical protein [Bacteroidales bacterium]HCY23683.1 hypothetical protein [Bacteroidales bacterium]
MISIRFENNIKNQVRIDNVLYELPYRIKSIMDFPALIVFHCSPDFKQDYPELVEKYKAEGRISLYAIDKSNKNVLWTMKGVNAVFVELPENKNEKDFLSKQHYENYMVKFKNKNLLSVYIGEFRKLIDADNGNVISSMEIR